MSVYPFVLLSKKKKINLYEMLIVPVHGEFLFFLLVIIFIIFVEKHQQFLKTFYSIIFGQKILKLSNIRGTNFFCSKSVKMDFKKLARIPDGRIPEFD